MHPEHRTNYTPSTCDWWLRTHPLSFMPTLTGRIVNHVYLHSSSIVSISRRPREGSGWAACTEVPCQLLSLLACSFSAPTSGMGAKKLTPSLQHFTCSSCKWYVHAHARTIGTMHGQFAATALQGLPNWNQSYPEIAILRMFELDISDFAISEFAIST